jgi:alpha-tubulin suppressor-like RCC1 family protein
VLEIRIAVASMKRSAIQGAFCQSHRPGIRCAASGLHAGKRASADLVHQEKKMILNAPRIRPRAHLAAVLLSALVFWCAGNSVAQTPLTGVAKISAGSFHTCALTNSGGVKCWGSNNVGQLGISLSQFSSSTPVDVTGLASGVVAIAAGGSHTCALTTTGGVKCWGLNQNGQLGDNGALNLRFTPADVSGLTSGAASIAAGLLTTCAVTTGGAAKCWGANGAGQLGDGTTNSPVLVPANVSGLASGVAAIATYNGHSCALTSGGGIKCWGQNASGQLGTGFPPVSSFVPVDVISAQSAPLLTGASAIVVNFAGSCALKNGGVLCWGENGVGQLGNNSGVSSSNVPVSVLSGDSAPPLSGVNAIATGRNHICALTDVGGVKCWGHNSSGQLGEGGNSPFIRTTPVDVLTAPAMPPLAGVSAITTGEQHTCALMNGGGVKCWGANFAGQVGDNSSGNYRFSPVDVVVVVPVNLSAVQSRRTHGAAGPFDLALDRLAPIHGSVTVEPRAIGAGHEIVFQFDGTITAPGTATAVNDSGATLPVSTPIIVAGNSLSVTLSGIADNSRATISLTFVNGIVVPFSVSLGFLIGDVNNSRAVDAIDISSVKARSGQITDSTNFAYDLNSNGAVSAADILTVKARAGAVLVP